MLPLKFAPKFITADGNTFAAYAETAAQDKALLNELRTSAEELMNTELYTVTKRKIRPASGNPHDYSSMGPYWWPNPDTPDGLPYVRHDGRINPDTRDGNGFGDLFPAIEHLTLAAYYLDNPAYAQKALDFIRTWYLNPETAMTPHLEYGQAIPGICTGRSIGIIDVNGNWRMLEAVALLDAMGYMPQDVMAGLKDWYGKFLDWMLTSEIGVDEERQHNNHGTFYDIQVAAYALFLDRPMLAERTLDLAYERRLLKHIQPDGKQPHELARTNAYGYSAMNLRGLMILGKMAKRFGCKTDYWHQPGAGGKPLMRAAVDYLRQYATSLEGFEYQQISGRPETDKICHILTAAATEYPDSDYAEQAKSLMKPTMLWRLWNM